jgi:microcompartment protein CcmL/EutN
MQKSLGFIELPNLADAIQAADLMLKVADVEFVTWEKKLGGRLVTIVVSGDVAAVTEAVNHAKANAAGRIVASAVIANPHAELLKLIERSRSKYDFQFKSRS